jgi:hypothetical protein
VNVRVKEVNRPPVADAGAEQRVQQGSLVTLDARASYDPDGDPLSFAWQQVSGQPVTLAGADTAQPAFVAPMVAGAGETLESEVTVTDGLASAAAHTRVFVERGNQAWIADAGPDAGCDEGTLVALEDVDGDTVVAWGAT